MKASVSLSGFAGVPSFSRWFQNNVRRSQEQQTAPNNRCTFPARRQSSDPPTLRSSRKVVGHQALVRFEVTPSVRYLPVSTTPDDFIGIPLAGPSFEQPATHCVLPRPELIRRRLIDDRHKRGAFALGRSEFTTPQEDGSHRGEVARPNIKGLESISPLPRRRFTAFATSLTTNVLTFTGYAPHRTC